MTHRLQILFLLAIAQVARAADLGEEFSGGSATVFDSSRNAFTFSIPNLSAERRMQFFVGNSFFNQNWIAAPASPKTRDGLGPLFAARSCSTCHFKDGRGASIETMAIRISLPGKTANGAPVPDPVYGGQIQPSALAGLRPEADVTVRYAETEGTFPDGEPYRLRRPAVELSNPGYGAISKDANISALTSPAVIGLGLLEAIPEETLRALADPHDRNGDGISGRLNMVWDESLNRLAVGRFGWKADQPSIHQQTAGAFNADMGITSSIFPNPNHTPAQQDCLKRPDGGQPEVDTEILGAMVSYLRAIAPPARRNWTNSIVRRGEKIFRELNCAACHNPTLKTGESPDLPELAHQTIRPYTDLLLHDMGEDLSDGRAVHDAAPREWRTPPLWGIGLIKTVNGHTDFLHDGRARNLTEAILWHGGEAQKSREAFKALPKADRQAVIEFLESL